MKNLTRFCVLPVLALSLSGIPAVAQDHPDNHTYQKHDDWKRGANIRHEDWDRGEKVDYHQYHLRKPPTGQEWRLIDGNYVLADANGRIVAVQVAARP
jgi:Ni/Co efflux regulator RcnB